MTYVIVAFRTDQVKSLYYRKTESLTALSMHVAKAFEAGAHFISIRCIK